jgi:predicted nuclease of predicted toxin-antitoxin system
MVRLKAITKTSPSDYRLTLEVSKDADFHERSFVLGPPPKVIWIRRRNCSTTRGSL